jgi:hypothetical protein
VLHRSFASVAVFAECGLSGEHVECSLSVCVGCWRFDKGDMRALAEMSECSGEARTAQAGAHCPSGFVFCAALVALGLHGAERFVICLWVCEATFRPHWFSGMAVMGVSFKAWVQVSLAHVVAPCRFVCHLYATFYDGCQQTKSTKVSGTNFSW